MKKLIIAAMIATAAMTPAHADQAYMSLLDYEQLEAGSKDKDGSKVVIIYLAGVVEAIGFANAILEDEKKPLLYCTNKGLSVELLQGLINKYIVSISSLGEKANEAKKILNVASVATKQLHDLYPCKK
jgi:hypothetical protein